jgi:hypothetical protein
MELLYSRSPLLVKEHVKHFPDKGLSPDFPVKACASGKDSVSPPFVAIIYIMYTTSEQYRPGQKCPGRCCRSFRGYFWQ